jgi:hypothetical protein
MLRWSARTTSSPQAVKTSKSRMVTDTLSRPYWRIWLKAASVIPANVETGIHNRKVPLSSYRAGRGKPR